MSLLQAKEAFRINLVHTVIRCCLLVFAAKHATAEIRHFNEITSDFNQLEEVIVSATKLGKTKLQKTPITLTNLSADELELSNIKNIKDMTLLLPNVTISQNVQSGQLYIRGVGTNNVFVGGDPSSTIHVDGVYLARPVSLFNELLVPERVEVLRGPQGTLYGRNATGGTINVISKKPDETFSAKLSGEFGSYDRIRASAFINGTLWQQTQNKHNKITSNLALLASSRDGYINNIHTDGPSKLNDEELKSARWMLRSTPTNTLDILVSADHFKRNEFAPQYKPTLNTVAGGVISGPQVIDDFWTLNIPLNPTLDEEHNSISITVNWAINEKIHFTSISAYRSFLFDMQTDTDFTEVPSRVSLLSEDQRQVSQELQLSRTDESYSAVIGLFYFDDNAESAFQALLQDRSPLQISFVDAQVKTTAGALYTDLQWHLNSQWTILLGGRYSWEEKIMDSLFRFDDGTAVLTTFTGEQDEQWNEFSPKLGFNYQLNIVMPARIFPPWVSL
jgi:iron complex outermembrane recepter protein